MSLSRCLYVNNKFTKSICNKPCNGSGFCEEHIQNTINLRYNKLSSRVLHHCFINPDSDIINACIKYHQMDQNEIDEVLGFTNLSSTPSSNLSHLFQIMLTSNRYFPSINNYNSLICVVKNNAIWWCIDKLTKKFILHKHFLISSWIQELSKSYSGIEDLLPRFLYI